FDAKVGQRWFRRGLILRAMRHPSDSCHQFRTGAAERLESSHPALEIAPPLGEGVPCDERIIRVHESPFEVLILTQLVPPPIIANRDQATEIWSHAWNTTKRGA